MRVFAALLLFGSAAADPLREELNAKRARLEREGRRPEAAAALLGIEDLLGWLPAQDVRAVVEVGARRGHHPLVRGLAEETLIRLDHRRGDPGLHARRRAHGFVEAWRILGPISDGASLARAEAVETARFDAAASYPGRARPVGWRALPDGLMTIGYVPLSSLLRPDQDACTYAITAVRSARAQAAALHVGSAGPLRVWIGPDLVIDRAVRRPPRPDQDGAAVRLGRGWNRVLVKTCVREGPWGFYLRFTDPAGRALPLETRADPETLASAAGGGRASHGIATLRAELERRTDAGGASEWADLAAWFEQAAPEDPSQKHAERARRRVVELSPTAEAWRRLGEASPDADERRRALEEAVRLDPRDARALTALARTHQELGRELALPGLLARVIEAAPDHLPARLALAAWWRSLGLTVAATEALRALEPKFARAARLLEDLADAERRADRPERALALWQRVLAEAADDTTAWRESIAIKRAIGDVDGALVECHRWIAARPDLSGGYLEKADLLAAAGRFDEAADAVRAALVVAPEEPRLHERLGRLLHLGGRRDLAVASLSRALDLGPHNPDLRAYLARLRPRDSAPLEGYARQFEAIPPADRASVEAGAPAVVLWDLSAVEMHAGGQSRALHQRAVQILDERGAREQAEFAIRYTPNRQQIDVRAARVRRDGAVVSQANRDEQELSEPWYDLYYDVRAQVLRFDDLRPGDVVELEYRIEDNTPHNLLGDSFAELIFLQESIPRREAEVVLVWPAARKLYLNDPRAPWIRRESADASGEEPARRVERLRLRGVPSLREEPGMPGFTEVAPYLHASTFATWSEVADWYAALVRDQLQDDAAIRAAVDAAVAGVSDLRARVRAVHNLVVRQTRYVGLEFGIHGYQPYRVTDVFSRKFGDCKDKAALLLVMMHHIGVEARMVLVRTRRGGDVADLPASLAIFDHAIVYLPAFDLYLDGTAEFSGTDELPAQDQGVPVLHIAPGETLRRTPVHGADTSRVEVALRGDLDRSGNARLHETLRLHGQAAAQWRRHYQSPAQRRDRYEQAWNERHAGARLHDVQMPEVEDLEAEVRVEADVQLPGLAQRQGRALSVPVAAREGELVRTYARQATRRHDLILDYPWTQESRLELVAPPGMTVGTLPRPRRIEAEFGTFDLDVRSEGDRITSRVRLSIADRRVPAARYPEFRRFLLQVDEALGERIEFRGE